MSNTTTAAEDLLREPPVSPGATTIGHRVDAFLASPARHPLVVVGIGILAGYLLARLRDR
jgi:hypothetical protein